MEAEATYMKGAAAPMGPIKFCFFPSRFPGHLNEPPQSQLQIDFRTGLPTALTGRNFSRRDRDDCSALNRLRAGGILCATQQSASGEPISSHGWSTLVARRAQRLEVPLIPLAKLGLSHTDEGFLVSETLVKLPSGAEAQPYLDEDAGIVYKLFDLTTRGSLGMKVVFRRESDHEVNLAKLPAILKDTLEKIGVLHDMGAHPTEIVGLAETGDFLIVKQPQARSRPYSKCLSDHYRLFEDERRYAAGAIKAVECRCQGLRETVVINKNEKAPPLCRGRGFGCGRMVPGTRAGRPFSKGVRGRRCF